MKLLLSLVAATALLAGGNALAIDAAKVSQALADPARSDADKALDGSRKPAPKLLLRDAMIHQQLVFLCALPMTHIFALTACGLLGMRKGGKLLLVVNPRDITAFIKLLIKHPEIHIFPGVNTLFHALIHHPEFKNVRLPNLLVTIGGGMAVLKKTADLWQKLTGVPIAQGYGLSETSPVVCVNTPFVKEFTGSIGIDRKSVV